MSKAVRELIIIIGIFIILNVTGLLSEVVSAVQRVVLFTGLMNPDIEEIELQKEADYNFTIVSLDGDDVQFSDFRGKVVFLNLWATWCGPCIAEMPNIQSLYDKVNKEEVVFVMLSLDDAAEKAKNFVERKGFTFPVYTPLNGIPAIYQTGSIPTTHVISPGGKILFSHKGTANYDTEKFRKFLLNNAK